MCSSTSLSKRHPYCPKSIQQLQIFKYFRHDSEDGHALKTKTTSCFPFWAGNLCSPSWSLRCRNYTRGNALTASHTDLKQLNEAAAAAVAAVAAAAVADLLFGASPESRLKFHHDRFVISDFADDCLYPASWEEQHPFQH